MNTDFKHPKPELPFVIPVVSQCLHPWEDFSNGLHEHIGDPGWIISPSFNSSLKTKAPSHCLVFDNQPPNKYLSGTLISIQNSMLCFQTDNRTSRKKRTLPVLLTQQFKGRRKMRVSCYRPSYRGSNVGIQPAEFVDLGLDTQEDKSFRQKLSLISWSTTSRPVKKKRKKQKETSEIMSSCWFRPSTVLSILIWRNCWLALGPPLTLCLWCIMFLVLCQPHTLLHWSHRA